MTSTFDTRYAAVSSRDTRFDGAFYTCVVSTGIYCRPSCPSRTPKRENCRFVARPLDAVSAGFRPCKRCRPDELLTDASGQNLARRALAAIEAGFLDDAGVGDLARLLHVSERHVQRILLRHAGATAAQLANSARCARAESLLRGTDLRIADVAFAAGFASVRHFNDSVRLAWGATPTQVRARSAAGLGSDAAVGRVSVRLPYTPPFDGAAALASLRAHAVPRVSFAGDRDFSRTLRAPGGPARVRVRVPWGDEPLHAQVELTELADLGFVVSSLRWWLDLDLDPAPVGRELGRHDLLRPLVAARPGLRLVRGATPEEAALLAVLGQQVSLAAAGTLASRLAALAGDELPGAFEVGLVDLVFPSAAQVAEQSAATLRGEVGLTAARAESLRRFAGVLAEGRVDLADRQALLAIPGIGPWTADVIALRALGDPDAFAPGDLVLRKALGLADQPVAAATRQAACLAEAWSPFRGYALLHLWHSQHYDSRFSHVS
ncbi:DNA-3-methyladenine glycosylase 2 family protein [Micrococcales bacterium 31B]|nr:DNA-3-methyladenine glycosylase 2 family protein [Micrococcales bacterium 31B]